MIAGLIYVVRLGRVSLTCSTVSLGWFNLTNSRFPSVRGAVIREKIFLPNSISFGTDAA